MERGAKKQWRSFVNECSLNFLLVLGIVSLITLILVAVSLGYGIGSENRLKKVGRDVSLIKDSLVLPVSNSLDSGVAAIAAAGPKPTTTTAAAPGSVPDTTLQAINDLVNNINQQQQNLAPLSRASDQLCVELGSAENATLRATACSNSQTISSLGCSPVSGPCYARFTNVKSNDAAVTLSSNNRTLSISVLEMYYIQWTGHIRSGCPVAAPVIEMSLVETVSNTTLYSFKLNGYGRQQFCTRAFLTPGTKIAFRIDDSSVTYPSDILSITASISTTPDLKWLQWAAQFSDNLNIQWIPFLPPSVTPGSPSYSPQYPTNTTVLPWLSNVIPHKFPAVCPPSPLAGLPNCNKYDKRRSVQESVGFFVYSNFSALPGNDPRTSVFLTNYADRGEANLRKLIYYAALVSRVLPFYQEGMQNFVNQVYSSWVQYEKPVLSSFKSSLVRFFLDVHVGVNDHPDYVIDYFSSFEDFVSAADLAFDGLYRSHINFKRVSEYMRQRALVVIANGDTSTITYWWNKAGFDPDNLVFEMVHNIVAFSQFGNVVFLIARDQTTGTPTLGANVAHYNFIAKYAAAATDEERLNVVRELYRLTVPNGVSFSFLREYANPNSPPVQTRHVHQLLMLTATGYVTNSSAPFNPANWAPYFQFDTTKYAPFTASLENYNCPAELGNVEAESDDPTQPFLPEKLLTISPIDNETVIDVCNPKATYVPPLPLYTPFGLGYRRCPGELFTYQITQMMLARFKNLQFYIGQAPVEQPIIGVAPFTEVPNHYYARIVPAPAA